MRYVFAFLTILTACSRPPETGNQLLPDIERLVWDAPDSALLLLKQVDTTLLDAAQYAEYILLKVQAKDKANQNIANDTAIFKVRDYFVTVKDSEKAARACYYTGRVYHERDYNEAALQAYLDAERKMKSLGGCDYLKGLIHFSIGDLYYEKEVTDEAIARYRTSTGYFERSQQKTNEMFAWNAIGTSFMISGRFDSALYYYNKVSKMPAYPDAPRIQSSVMRNIGIISRHTGEPEKARRLFARALELNEDEQLKARLYICLSQAYQGLHRNDSAAFFIEQAMKLCEQNPKPPMAAIYKTLIDIEESRENYPKALEYAQKQMVYERLIHEKYEETQLAEFEKKYNYMAEREKDKNYWIVLLSTCLIIAVIAVALLVWVIRSRKRIAKKDRKINELSLEADEHRKEIALLKEAISREQENIGQLEIEKKAIGENTSRGVDIEMQIKDREENIDQLVEQIRLSFAVKLKIHLKLYERYEQFKLKHDEKIRKSFILVDQHLYGETGQINWNTVYLVLMPKNLEKSIKDEYEILNTNEVRLSCLLLFDVSYVDIANILHISQGSAHTFANRIRNKLGITDIPAALKHLLHK